MADIAKKYLFIINDAPYGNERPYNALRLALNLVKGKLEQPQVPEGTQGKRPGRRQF
ncbi:MAG: hypothetical protein Q7T47_01065 [Anaerolineales bacterium]|nr:hypothetical protein [Anaerolineales bacterium]